MIEISKVEAGKTIGVIFYDLERLEVVDDLTDYFAYLAFDKQLHYSRVFDDAYAMRKFWCYLWARKICPDDCSNAILVDFRDAELADLMKSSLAKGKDRIAKRTVNSRLRRIYDWLAWLKQSGRASARLIGSRGCRVTSTLAPDAGPRAVGPQRSREGQERYPCLFKRTGASSRHRTAYSPTDQIRLETTDRLMGDAESDFLAHRNALLIDIANSMGFRRGSILSLTVEQIEYSLKMQPHTDYVYVCPSAQKNGYSDTFEMPAWMAVRIKGFVDDYFRPYATHKGWKLDVGSSKVFVSAKTGMPLTPRSVTKLVSKALRASGAPRFSSIHSFRHKFAREGIEAETEYRKEHGLDTSLPSITASMSLRLGHKSDQSIRPYVAEYQHPSRRRAEALDKKDSATLEDEIRALKREIKRLANLVRD